MSVMLCAIYTVSTIKYNTRLCEILWSIVALQEPNLVHKNFSLCYPNTANFITMDEKVMKIYCLEIGWFRTPIRAKAQDTRANPNSWETNLVRKRWDIGLLREPRDYDDDDVHCI